MIADQCKEDSICNLFGNVQLQELKLPVPTFQLDEKLKNDLSQQVVNRCSLYATIFSINKATLDIVVKEGRRVNIKQMNDECSPLVLLAKNEKLDVFHTKDSSDVEFSIIDEESFLLTINRSREQEGGVFIRPSLACFSEAIGETEDCSQEQSEDSYSTNSQSSSSSLKTQLWKPGRSWWEAKSRKNPWIERKSHNKRWWYLWPLVQYHKFLIKCIKKLKRHNIDVSISSSSICAFLREEVCAISGHLSTISKFTSEDWMEGLTHFNGWTSQDPESEKSIKVLVQSLPTRTLLVAADAVKALPENLTDRCFMIAMSTAKDRINSGWEERNRSFEDEERHVENNSAKQLNQSRSSTSEKCSPSNRERRPSRRRSSHSYTYGRNNADLNRSEEQEENYFPYGIDSYQEPLMMTPHPTLHQPPPYAYPYTSYPVFDTFYAPYPLNDWVYGSYSAYRQYPNDTMSEAMQYGYNYQNDERTDNSYNMGGNKTGGQR